jgi:hypothetical protein
VGENATLFLGAGEAFIANCLNNYMLRKIDYLLSGKRAYTDPVPWNLTDIIKFALFAMFVIIILISLGILTGYLCPHYQIVRKYHPVLFRYSLMNIISIFAYFYIIKIWILKKYIGGMKILFESKNKTNYFVWALIVGFILQCPLLLPIFGKKLYIIQSPYIKMPLLLFVLKYIISMTIFSPIFEEIIYRSFIYRALKKKIDVTCSITVTSILFASTHWHAYLHPESFIAIFIFGFVMNLFYEKTGSLYGCILSHSISNFIHFMILRFFPV